MPPPLQLTAFTATTALGRGLEPTLQALLAQRSGLRPNDFGEHRVDTWIGHVDGLEAITVPATLADYDCRNNRLALLGLQQDGFLEAVERARQRYGASRVGVILGTSTSGNYETEMAYRRFRRSGEWPGKMRFREQHNLYALTDFVRQVLDVNGPAHVISTACSSSAKVFASAARFIRQGVCDAVVVGGVDTLSMSTLHGFTALELTSPQPCRPWDATRNGISIGEASGFALLEAGDDADIVLLGYGESSDAYHMSTPHPEGAGAAQAMRAALERAHLSPADIDYINLHGTGTPSNDAAEDAAVMSVFGNATPCSSTKSLTGHTLGAAGIVEGVISALCLRHGLVPGSPHTQARDPALQADFALQNRRTPLRRVMSNSFGFGGNNCALLFAKAGA